MPGFAYQCGALIAGTVAYLEALLAGHMSYAQAMALTAVIVFGGRIVATLLGPERRAVKFG